MATSAFNSSPAGAGLTYARARLWLGISGVGSAVALATILLALDVPARLLSTSAAQPLGEALTSLVLVLALGLLLFLPFDVLGGAVVVRERPSAVAFALRWLRGVAVQLIVWTAVAAVLMTAARAAGESGAIAAIVVLQLVLAQFRGAFALAIASMKQVELPPRLIQLAKAAGLAPERIRLVETSDEGFVGGWSGISPQRLVLPARWLDLPDAALVATLRRRRIIAESGAHRRGVLGAIAWNTLGFASVLALSAADAATAAGLMTIAAGMTLWAFLGVLLLPTPSRAAVFVVDARAAQESGEAPLRDAIERLDRWQDDEERRSAGVETVFHPVPSRSARLARIGSPSAGGTNAVWSAHHLARHALWLGWVTLSPLSRLVHCNVGRPALWAMLPGD